MKYLRIGLLRRILLMAILVVQAMGIVVGQRVSNVRNMKLSDEQDFHYAFTEGTKYYLFGNYVQAITLYKECLKIKPDNATVYFQLSKIYTNAGNTSLAREYGKKACLYAADNVWYLQNLVDLFQIEQKYDSAAVVLKALIALKPENANYHYAMASLNEKLGHYQEALNNLEQVDKRIGLSREVILTRYRIYEAMGLPEKAVQQLKEAGNLNDEEYNINGLIADYYRKANKPDSAQKYYNKIFPAYGHDPLVIFSYSGFLLQKGLNDSAVHIIGKVLSDRKIDNMVKAGYFYNVIQNQEDYKTVRPIIDTITSIYYQTYYDDVRVMSIYADIQVRLKNTDKAIGVLKRISVNDPKNFPAVEQLLYMMNIANQTDSLLIYSDRALVSFKDRPLIYLFNGSAKYQTKRYEEAVTVLNRGIDIVAEPQLKAEFYSLLAECYQQLKLYTLSGNAFNQAMEIDPENITIKNNYAYYLALRNEDLKKALALSLVTIKEEPENFTYLDTYAWVCFKMNKYKEAKKYIDLALEHDSSKNTDVLKHASEIYVKLKKYDDAIGFLNQIIRRSGTENRLELEGEIKRIEQMKNGMNK